MISFNDSGRFFDMLQTYITTEGFMNDQDRINIYDMRGKKLYDKTKQEFLWDMRNNVFFTIDVMDMASKIYNIGNNLVRIDLYRNIVNESITEDTVADFRRAITGVADMTGYQLNGVSEKPPKDWDWNKSIHMKDTHNELPAEKPDWNNMGW